MTSQTLKHPVAVNILHIGFGFLIATLLQHGIDIHEQIATLHQFFASDTFHGAIAAGISIWSAISHGVTKDPTSYLTTITSSIPGVFAGPSTQLPPTPGSSPAEPHRDLPPQPPMPAAVK